jgi:hypothetical protein
MRWPDAYAELTQNGETMAADDDDRGDPGYLNEVNRRSEPAQPVVRPRKGHETWSRRHLGIGFFNGIDPKQPFRADAAIGSRFIDV